MYSGNGIQGTMASAFACSIYLITLVHNGALGYQQLCKDYFDGFSLQEGYNRNIAPTDNTTVFALQHVEDIVKVSILNNYSYIIN